MKKIKIGINGFGRIGRVVTRIMLSRKNLQLMAINSRADASSHAYLLQYDSTYKTYPTKVTLKGSSLKVGDKIIKVFQKENPHDIPWGKENVDIVIDSTGKFRTTELLSGHLKDSVKNVILSAPAKDETKTFVMGVNEKTFNPHKDKIISNSSCTTNCLATTLKVLHDSFKVKKGFMTTVHAVTDSQNLLDNSHKKEIRLRRAAFASMIPTSTGSAKDIGKLYPDLKGLIVCRSIRVPLLTVSLIILTVEVKYKTSKEKINEVFVNASQTKLKGILATSVENLVSSDFIGSPFSSIVDLPLTEVINSHLVTVYAWYDNEWGYATRLVDMVEYIGKKTSLING